MANIISMVTDEVGEIGQPIRRVRIITSDNLSTVTTANWLSQAVLNSFAQTMVPTDMVCIWYGYNSQLSPGTFGIFTPTISNGVITLVDWVSSGDVLLPVVDGDFANFNGTSGQIKDAGYSPSNAAKTKVVMATGAVTANHIATYTDTAGTIGQDAATAINLGNIQAGNDSTKGQLLAYGGSSNGHILINPIGNTANYTITLQNAVYGQASVLTIPDPGAATANFLLDASGTNHTLNYGLTAVSFTASTGAIQALQNNVLAGSSGHAGTLTSFPATTANGSFVLAAINNTGNFTTTLSNSNIGQATVYSLPDTATATANVLAAGAALVSGNVVKASGTAGAIVDAGFALHSGTTAPWGGGGTSNIFTTTNMTSASIVAATILSQGGTASIVSAVPGTNTLTVTFSADPGANTTINWISVTAVA